MRVAGSTLSALVASLMVLAGSAEAADVELFTRTGCPHCAEAKRFLDALAAERPGLTVVEWPVDADAAARARLEALAVERSLPMAGVPALLVGGELVVGFDRPETTGQRVRALLEGRTGPALLPSDGLTCAPEETVPCEDEGVIEAPLVGRLDATALGLPLFTVAVGLLDGFNPCAMWVLLFLLSMLVNMKSRRRMAVVAGVFVLASGVVYFAFMAAWLNVFLLLGFSRVVQVALGVLGLGMGALNVKEFFAFKQGPSLTIPEAAKPGIGARMRAVVQAENLPAALAAVVVLAVLVNLVELLCTAGLPALYTHVLTAQALPRWQNYAYLGLYNVAYMADDGLMVGVAVFTLSRRRLAEKEGRWLKLLSGAVMVVLAVVLLLRPQWLSALG